MTKAEQQDLEALKIGFENTEWEDFLLVLNEIRQRDKDIIKLYRKSFIELKELKKALAKEEKANTPELLDKQKPKALIIDGVMLPSCPNCGSKEQMPFFNFFKCMECEMRHDGQDEA